MSLSPGLPPPKGIYALIALPGRKGLGGGERTSPFGWKTQKDATMDSHGLKKIFAVLGIACLMAVVIAGAPGYDADA